MFFESFGMLFNREIALGTKTAKLSELVLVCSSTRYLLAF